jgi:hypothetical protein
MDAAFLVVVGMALCLLTGMVVFRMGAAGVPTGRIVLPIIELWVVFALAIALFSRLSGGIGTPVGVGGAGEARNLASRLAALDGMGRMWAAAGLTVSVALLAHLMWMLGRAMSEGPGR